MTYEKMEEIAKNHLGGEIKHCDDETLTIIFDAIKAENGGQSIPGGAWMKLSQAISMDIVYEDAIWDHFNDQKMLSIYKDRKKSNVLNVLEDVASVV